MESGRPGDVAILIRQFAQFPDNFSRIAITGPSNNRSCAISRELRWDDDEFYYGVFATVFDKWFLGMCGGLGADIAEELALAGWPL